VEGSEKTGRLGSQEARRKEGKKKEMALSRRVLFLRVFRCLKRKGRLSKETYGHVMIP
jgi:hypothetical protein